MTVYDIIILEWDLSEWTWDTQDNQANEHFIVWNSLQDYGVNGCAYTDFILCSRASNGPLVAELFAPVLLMANELASPFLHSIWSGPWLAQGLHKPLFTQTIMHTHANMCAPVLLRKHLADWLQGRILQSEKSGEQRQIQLLVMTPSF